MTPDRITIPTPFNRHFHAREGLALNMLGPLVSSVFQGAVCMGNTSTPIVTAEDANSYREAIKTLTTPGFEPRMTIMLVNRTTPEIVEEAWQNGVCALKLIPGGTSTNSAAGKDPNAGVSLWDLERYYPVLAKCQELGMPFFAHWELIADELGREIPEIKREEAATPFLLRVYRTFPMLKIVVEHVSTEVMVNVLVCAPLNVIATIAPHHAWGVYDQVMDENGQIKDPGLYCKPILKRSADRDVVRERMVSGNWRFGFGDDCAYHPYEKKFPPSGQPAAGIFNPFSLLVCAQIFENSGRLFDKTGSSDCFTNFVSLANLEVYGWRPATNTVTLVRQPWIVPSDYKGTPIFFGGQTLDWQIEGWNWKDYLV